MNPPLSSSLLSELSRLFEAEARICRDAADQAYLEDVSLELEARATAARRAEIGEGKARREKPARQRYAGPKAHDQPAVRAARPFRPL